jgi:hypothetical protein
VVHGLWSWSAAGWSGSGSASALDPVCKVGKVEEGVVVVAVEKGWRCDERTRREEKRR